MTPPRTAREHLGAHERLLYDTDASFRRIIDAAYAPEEVRPILDKYGRVVRVGDIVVFSTSGGMSTVSTGVVSRITDHTVQVYLFTERHVTRRSTKRISQPHHRMLIVSIDTFPEDVQRQLRSVLADLLPERPRERSPHGGEPNGE